MFWCCSCFCSLSTSCSCYSSCFSCCCSCWCSCSSFCSCSSCSPHFQVRYIGENICFIWYTDPQPLWLQFVLYYFSATTIYETYQILYLLYRYMCIILCTRLTHQLSPILVKRDFRLHVRGFFGCKNWSRLRVIHCVYSHLVSELRQEFWALSILLVPVNNRFVDWCWRWI